MSLVCQCPSCKAKYQLGDQFAGSKIKCPKCGAAVQVPEAAQAAPKAAPSAAPVATAPIAAAKPIQAKAAPTAAKPQAAKAEAAAPRVLKAAPITRPAALRVEPKEPAREEAAEDLVGLDSINAGSISLDSIIEDSAEAAAPAKRFPPDDDLGFLDGPAPAKRQTSLSGIDLDAPHDGSVLTDDFVAHSSIGARSSKAAGRGSKSSLSKSSLSKSSLSKSSHSKSSLSQLHKKKKQALPPWAIPAMAGGGVLVAGLVLATILMWPHPAPVAAAGDDEKKPAAAPVDPNVPLVTFTFKWPESERSGATLTINGELKELPAQGDIKFKLPLSKQAYTFVLERKGFAAQKFSRPLVEDDDYTVANWESTQPKGVVEWEQDFDAAKKAAADQHKDVLVVFDASDAAASRAASSRFNESVASRSEFSDRANKDFVCVYIDNPENDAAKEKVKDLARNQKLTKKFRVGTFPTVVVADPTSRPFGIMEGYKINGIDPFLELLDKWQEDRKTLFSLLDRINADKEHPDADLLRKAINFLSLNGLDRIYQHTIQNWTAKLPQGQGLEVTEQDYTIWEGRFSLCLRNPDMVKETIAAFDRWKVPRSFKKHPDIGARLSCLAALLLVNIGDKDAAKKKCDEGLAFGPKDARTRAFLAMIEEALTGKPGEHVILPRGSGSGFCIASGNYIMTNHHVIHEAKKIMVHLNGEEEKCLAHLVADDEDGDMAVIKADLPAGKALVPIPFVPTDVIPGDEVCAFGWPGLLSDNPMSTLTKGVISTIDGKEGFLVTDCRIDHGNSGGPLCSVANCSICGMVSRVTGIVGDLHEQYGMAIPASKLKAFLKEKLPPDVLKKIPRPTDVSGTTFSDTVKHIQPSAVYVENYQ